MQDCKRGMLTCAVPRAKPNSAMHLAASPAVAVVVPDHTPERRYRRADVVRRIGAGYEAGALRYYMKGRRRPPRTTARTNPSASCRADDVQSRVVPATGQEPTREMAVSLAGLTVDSLADQVGVTDAYPSTMCASIDCSEIRPWHPHAESISLSPPSGQLAVFGAVSGTDQCRWRGYGSWLCVRIPRLHGRSSQPFGRRRRLPARRRD